MNKYDDTDYQIEREESIEYKENKKMTVGEIIDNLLENPELIIKEFSKMLRDCKKVNEELQIKLKNKQSEIDFLKGQLAVYEKFLKEEELEDE